MEVKLDVLASLTIKRKKPWSKFSWLEESEPPHGLYLFSDGGRISQLSLSSGKTRRKFPTLSTIQDKIALTCTSPSGSHLGGLTLEGDLFLWHKETDVLVTFVSPLSRMGQEKMSTHAFKDYRLFLSDSGEQALLMTNKSEMYLWELKDYRSLWWKLFPPEGIQLPKPAYRETAVDAMFHVHPILGETCHCVFVFTNRTSNETVITHLLINWPSPPLEFYRNVTAIKNGNSEQCAFISSPFVSGSETVSKQDGRTTGVENEQIKHGNVQSLGPGGKKSDSDLTSTGSVLRDRTNISTSGSTIKASSIEGSFTLEHSLDSGSTKRQDTLHTLHTLHTHFDQLSMFESIPPFETSWSTVTKTHLLTHSSLTGRGAYVCRLSPSCSVVALAVNQNEAADTRVWFFSPLVKAGLASCIYHRKVEGNCGRTFWLADMAWTPNGLFLICISKRGSILVLPRFGPPVKLFARGCSIEMGPSTFLPLHPLITIIGVSKKITDHETSQSSERDALRQRFSVATHPHLPIFLCSDGYSVSVLKLPSNLSLPELLVSLVSTSRELLSLPPISFAGNLPSGSDPQNSLQHHNLQDVAASILDDACLGDTLGSTLDSNRGHGFMSALTGVDAGGIHFAGLGSTLEVTGTSSLRQTELQCAVAQLVSGWSLTLTGGLVDPADGVSTRVCPMDAIELEISQTKLKIATNVLVSSILSLLELLHENVNDRDGNLQTIVSSEELIGTLFSLIPLDSLSQSHKDAVTTLTNGVIISKLRRCLNKHKMFSSIKDELHTQQSLIEYVRDVTIDLSEISELLDNVLAVLVSTYSLTPVNSSCFHTPSLLQSQAKDYTPSLLSSLSPACAALMEVTQALQHDVSTCEEIVKKQVSTAVAAHESRLQTREMSVLYNKLTDCLNEAVVALQYAQTQASGIRAPDGNPITLDPPVGRKLRKLISKLEQYDIQGALEYAHSFVDHHDTINSQDPRRVDAFKLTKSGKDVLLFLSQVMATFFCEQSPTITIPSLGNRSCDISLSRANISKAVQTEAVSVLWSVDHTLELFLLSQSFTEACEFLQRLGDWKKAFLLATVDVHHSRLMKVKSQSYAAMKQFAHSIATKNILRVLGIEFKDEHVAKNRDSVVCKPEIVSRSKLSFFTDSHLQRNDVASLISECFKVCAFAGQDCVLLSVTTMIVSEIAHCCKQLSMEVPSGVYLPAPPLFCPQPAVQNEGSIQCPHEYRLRNKMASLVQCLVLVLRSSHTVLSCAQWYTSHLLTTCSDSLEAFCLPGNYVRDFPDDLSRLAQKDTIILTTQDSPTACVLVASFRQLCGLLWFLHVRDQFTLHLRKIQPSVLKKNNSQEDVRKAALWSARYLSFSSILNNSKKTTFHSLEGTALTVFSELNTDGFLADLLAHCFPDTLSSDSLKEEGKLKRLLSRLRSAQDIGEPSQTLSVRYQTKSQFVSSQRQKDLGDDNLGKFCELVLSVDASYFLHTSALNVGSLLYEYDPEYSCFLNTLFSIILPETSSPTIFSSSNESSLLTVSQLKQSTTGTDNDHTPLLSEYLSKMSNVKTRSSAPWQRVLPLLEAMHLWAHTTGPHVCHSRPETKKRKTPKRSSKKYNTKENSLKVNLSAKLVISCLRQRENGIHTPKVTSKPQLVAPQITTSHKSEKRERRLDIDDLDGSARHSKDVRNKDQIESTVLGAQPSVEIMGKDSPQEPPPLIQVPHGTLKGQLSEGSLLYDSVQSSLPPVHQKSSVESQREVEETELEESVSTGEMPSGLTYSVGEKRQGSEVVTYTEDNLLADTLTEISETVTLTFNDLVLPTSSSSNKSAPHLAQNDDDNVRLSEEELSQDNFAGSQRKEEPQNSLSDVQNTLFSEGISELGTNELDHSILYGSEQQNGNEDLDMKNLNAGLEQENGNEDFESGDSGTFTVSSNTTLVKGSQSDFITDMGSLDTTLEAIVQDEPHIASLITDMGSLDTTLEAIVQDEPHIASLITDMGSLDTTLEAIVQDEPHIASLITDMGSLDTTLEAIVQDEPHIASLITDMGSLDTTLEAIVQDEPHIASLITDMGSLDTTLEAIVQDEPHIASLITDMGSLDTTLEAIVQDEPHIASLITDMGSLDTTLEAIVQDEPHIASLPNEAELRQTDKELQTTQPSLKVETTPVVKETNEQLISSAVRTEMREILQLQQEQIITLLKAVEAKTVHEKVQNVDSGTQKYFESEEQNDAQEKSPDSSKRSHGSYSKSHDKSDDSTEDIMPILNLEDLQSPSETSYSNPSSNEISRSLPLGNASQKHMTQLSGVQSTYSTKKKGQKSKRKVHSSGALDTPSVDSPGVIPALSQTSTSTTREPPHAKLPIMSTPRPSNTVIPGPILSQFSQIGQTRTDIPLLHLDSSVNATQGGQSFQENRAEDKLENAYPDLVRNLTMIAPHTPSLSIPHKTDSRNGGKCLPSSKLPLLGLTLLTQNTPSSQRQGLLVQQCGVSAVPPRPPSQLPALLALPDSLPQQYGPQAPIHPLHTQPHNSHTYHHHPAHPQPYTPITHTVYAHSNQQGNYQLPNVPLTPFIPKLLPQPKKQSIVSAAQIMPPLLRANDPWSEMKQHGIKLLEIPKSQAQFNPPKLISFNTQSQPPQLNAPLHDQKAKTSEVRLPVTKLQTSSASDEGHPLPKETKKNRGSRKRKRHSNQKVTLEQQESTSVVSQMEMSNVKEIDLCLSKTEAPAIELPPTLGPTTEQCLDQHSQQVPAIELFEQSLDQHNQQLSPVEDLEGPTLRKPNLFKDSQRSYPVDIPLESLEVRRLNLQASTLPQPQTNNSETVTIVSQLSETDVSVQLDSDSESVHVSDFKEKSFSLSSLSSLEQSDKDLQVSLPPQADLVQVSSHTKVSPTEPTRSVHHDTEALKEGPSSSYEKPTSNNVYHPPILALNVIDFKDSNEIAMSVSSGTLTPCEQAEVVPLDIQIEARELIEKTSPRTISNVYSVPNSLPTEAHELIGSHYDIEKLPPLPKLSKLGNDENRTCVHFQESSDKDETVEVLGDLVAHTKPGSVTCTALKRLQELEEQLNAIENTAKNVEGEFKTSKQILHTIDQLRIVTEPLSDSEDSISNIADQCSTDEHSTLDQFLPDNEDITPELNDQCNSEVIVPLSYSETTKDEQKRTHFQSEVESSQTLANLRKQKVKEKRKTDSSPTASSRLLSSDSVQGRLNLDKEKVKGWMVAKRKERLAEFREEKESLRKKEKHPFSSPNRGTGSTNLHSLRLQKKKRDQQRQFVSKRIEDAYSLMNDMLSTKPIVTTKSSPPTPLSRLKQGLPPNGKASRQSIPMSTRGGSKRQREDESKSDSLLIRGKVEDQRHLSGTYTKPSNGGHLATSDRLESVSSPKRHANSPLIRKISSTEGLTAEEQDHIADILASTDYDGHSVSSGSILTDIDWDEVDRILDC